MGSGFVREWESLPTTADILPVLDPSAMSKSAFQRAVANSLEQQGMLLLRSPRADARLSERLQRETGQFFAQSNEVKQATVNAEAKFQGGWTPDFAERPLPQNEFVASLAPSEQPFPATYPKDPKERFMQGVGSRRGATRYTTLTPQTLILKGYEAWHRTMDRWGMSMLADARLIMEAYCGRYKLKPNGFAPLTYGGNIVAPTGTNLLKYQAGTVVAGLHPDMGVLSGHEPSVAFLSGDGEDIQLKPLGGLIAWTRDGRRMRVVVPNGCRLFQAGLQLAFISGGRVLAGMHQVIVPPQAEALVEEAKARNLQAWRISSTLFVHLDADKLVTVPAALREKGRAYETVYAGDLDMQVLNAIFAQG